MPVDDDELLDLLLSIEENVPQQDKPLRFEREADALAPGTYGRASLLIAAGGHWQMRREFDEARRCFHEARVDGGESRSDPVANLLSLALDEGDAASVKSFDQQLRTMAREDSVSLSTYHLIAESYEDHDELRSALRWCNIPFTHGDPSDDVFDEMLLVTRRRVRVALGMPPDHLDLMVDDD